jgi:hypothetical protein
MPRLNRNKSVWILVALGSLGMCVLGWQFDSETALADHLASPAVTGTGLITHVLHIDGRPTQLIVVDTAQRRLAVYYVSQESGEIQLKSVRNILADLSMQEFNSGDPSPLDIQKLKERN